MPELPEVETARRGMESAMHGKTIKSVQVFRHDLRVPIPQNLPTALNGKVCIQLKRRGKYIILIFSDDIAVVLHLGMSGRIRIYQSGQNFNLQTHDHIHLTLDDGTQIVFHDPRRFGMFYTTSIQNWMNEKPFSEMGPEPLENWELGDFLRALQKRKGPIKPALLDQTVVSGLGNIYVCEALYFASISPLRSCNTIKVTEAKKLVECTQKVLKKAITAGGSTLRNYQRTDGSLGYFQYQFSVYDRESEKCLREKCKGTIKRIIQGGRSTFYCPVCQK